jgi:hypothetical protein
LYFFVFINLENHGYSVGSIFSILASTDIGNTSLYGEYIVKSIVDNNNFIITASASPTRSRTAPACAAAPPWWTTAACATA